MAISMYQASVPVFIRFLNNFNEVLKKGETFAEAKTIEPEVLINARLAPDMFSLVTQVQVACALAKRCGERLTGAEVPSVEDNEKTFAELYERINNTIAFLETIKPDQIDGKEEKIFTLELRGYSFDFKGIDYVLYFVLPNLYFHITTAYDILRHNGVELGKKDFIGKFPV